MPFSPAIWLVPPAFALHVPEEAPSFTRWVNRHISDHYRHADFVKINAVGMAMTLAATALVSHRPARPLVFAYFTAIVCQQAANAGFHAGTTAGYGAYSPAWQPRSSCTCRCGERCLGARAAGA